MGTLTTVSVRPAPRSVRTFVVRWQSPRMHTPAYWPFADEDTAQRVAASLAGIGYLDDETVRRLVVADEIRRAKGTAMVP